VGSCVVVYCGPHPGSGVPPSWVGTSVRFRCGVGMGSGVGICGRCRVGMGSGIRSCCVSACWMDMGEVTGRVGTGV